MATNDQFVITPEKIDQWKAEAKVLRGKIDDLQLQYDGKLKDIENGQWFLRGRKFNAPPTTTALPFREEAQEHSSGGGQIKNLNPGQAILAVLRDAGPILQRDVKARLQAAGYPMGKFGASGNYFYSVIMRLHKTGKIHKDGDKLALK